MIPGNANPLLLASAADAAAAAVATKSLRFASGDSAYLNRTPSSAGNRKTFTLSFWLKRAYLGNWQVLFFAGNSSTNTKTDRFRLYLRNDDQIELVFGGGTGSVGALFSPKLRDASAWYNLVFAIDMNQSAIADGIKLYINGVQAPAPSNSGNVNYSTFDTAINNNVVQEIGRNGNNSEYFGGFIADCMMVDGSQLDATSFGAYDDNGVWQAAEYSGTFGTNGFHLLDFASESTVGHDSSGNENDFTANNITNETPTSLPAVSQTKAGNSYLSVPASDDFDFGTGDFTIEFFLYVIRSGSNNAIFDFRDSGSSAQYFLRMTSSTSCNLRYSGTDLGTFSITSGSWNHVAISRSSGTTKVFVDGTQTNSFSDTNDASNTGPLLFGTFNDTTGTSSSYGFDGQISNLRIVKGTAVYTSAFTTPTAPLSNITNTKLLCCQSNTSATAATVTPGTLTASNATAVQFSDSSSDQDVLFDVPTNGTQSDTGSGGEVSGNYATLNPLEKGSAVTLSNGNLNYSVGASSQRVHGTIGVSSGKWFWEETKTSGTYGAAGISKNVAPTTFTGNDAHSWSYNKNGNKYHSGTGASYGATWDSGDTIGVAFDADNGSITFYKNGVSQGVAYSDIPVGDTYFPACGDNATVGHVNFGQRAFAYSAPSGFKALCTTNLPTPTIADGSDYFDTKLYTGNGGSKRIGGSTTAASSGVTATGTGGVSGISTTYPITGAFDGATSTYLATNSGNITSTAAVLTVTFPSGNQPSYSSSVVLEVWASTTDTVKVAINGGSYQTVSAPSSAWQSHTVASGSGTITEIKVSRQKSNTNAGAAELRAIIVDGAQLLDGNADNLSFQPDWVWIKNRGSVENHSLNDSVRGVNKQLQSSTTTAETTHTNQLTSFNANGFTVGSSSQVNENNVGQVAWCWNAGSSTVSNTDGSITSSVRANPSAGFSIVTYSGNSTSGATIGHGLNAAPEFVVVKARNIGTQGWCVYHASLGATKYIQLDTTNAASTYSGTWNNTSPTNSVFTVGNDNIVNTGYNYVAYCFTPVAGYSAFGSYTGNGSNDGPFVHTGFRPGWLMIKRTDSTSNWVIIDAARSSFNEVNDLLYAEQSLAETVDDGNNGIDFLSNGFKLRKGVGGTNVNGATLIYIAFAENPFQANGGLAR